MEFTQDAINKDIILKIVKVKKVITQLKALKRLKKFRKPGTQEDVQLKVSRFILIIYAKFIKKN